MKVRTFLGALGNSSDCSGRGIGHGHTRIPPENPRGCWVSVDSILQVTPRVTPASLSDESAAKSLVLESARLGEHAV